MGRGGGKGGGQKLETTATPQFSGTEGGEKSDLKAGAREQGRGKKAGMGPTVLHFGDTQDMPVELTYRLISNEQK